MKPRISMVSLGVKDVAASAAFYREGLGLPQIESPPQVAFFKLEGAWLGLCERAELAKDAGVSAQGQGYTAINLCHNVVSERDVRRLMEEAVNAGAKEVKKPQPAHWGGYHGYFADPDGHLWEVCYNPFMWVGPPDRRG